jgi:hypothetical protein
VWLRIGTKDADHRREALPAFGAAWPVIAVCGTDVQPDCARRPLTAIML